MNNDDHEDLKNPEDKLYWPNGQRKDKNDMYSGANNFGGTVRNSLGELYEDPCGNPIRGPQAPDTNYDFDPGEKHKGETWGAAPVEPKTTVNIKGPEEVLEIKVECLTKALQTMESVRSNIMKSFNNKIPITLACQLEAFYHSLYYQYVLETNDLNANKAAALIKEKL